MKMSEHQTPEQRQIELLEKKIDLYKELVSEMEDAVARVGNNNRVEMAVESFEEAMEKLEEAMEKLEEEYQ